MAEKKETMEVSLIAPQEGKPSFETLVVQGTKYKTLVTLKYKNRKKWEYPNEKHIVTVIPGTIKQLDVKTGDTVERDQPMLILEAMKMENTMFAPFSGTLKSVNVKVGDRIPKGTVIIEFE